MKNNFGIIVAIWFCILCGAIFLLRADAPETQMIHNAQPVSMVGNSDEIEVDYLIFPETGEDIDMLVLPQVGYMPVRPTAFKTHGGPSLELPEFDVDEQAITAHLVNMDQLGVYLLTIRYVRFHVDATKEGFYRSVRPEVLIEDDIEFK